MPFARTCTALLGKLCFTIVLHHIFILGGGSAGLMAAASLKVNAPALRVTLVRSSDIGIIGVGEGSTPGLTRFLHHHLQIPVDLFIWGAQPTWKLGIRFLWGPRPYFNFPLGPGLALSAPLLPRPVGFYCNDEMEWEEPTSSLMTAGKCAIRAGDGRPVLPPAYAYHIENENFVAFLEKVALAAGVEIVDDTLVDVLRDEGGVRELKFASGRLASADLYVDCSGFASVLLGKSLAEPFVDFAPSLSCDRAVVGGWDRSAEPILPYTLAETMPSGWAWQIEHEHRINRGYVYSSAFVDDDEAERQFRQSNPRVTSTRIVRFRTGRYRNAFVCNVVAIGNASGFVEPLEATALGVIAGQCTRLTHLVTASEGQLTATLIDLYNQSDARVWDDIRRFIAIHYKYNARLDTPFWRHCREKTDLAGGEKVVEYYQQNGPAMMLANVLVDPASIWGLEGYITILTGQRLDRPVYRPPPAQAEAWQRWRAENKRQAEGGLGVKEVLENCRRGMFPTTGDGRAR